ncbi:hypothetical protein HED60_14285 [Planctomycetales bacterium ZRK34]|nr:hypothetical protein HED60_14285 [Planctomycetales bacterium ZRK34]
MIRFAFTATVVLFCALGVLSEARGDTFYYTGPASGDFFTESNWTANSDGSGASPAVDQIPDSDVGGIFHDLIIDGDSVLANGQVDFGTGSLTLQAGAQLDITGTDNDLDINPTAAFSLTNATLNVNDIITFDGNVSLTGGSVTSVTDDISFNDDLASLSVDGTTFTTADNIYFDAFVGTIANATFNTSDRLGLRQNVAVVMTSSQINVNGGFGDIDDVFGTAGAGSSLTLLGSSTLLADSVEEGVDLILGDQTTATMGGQGARIVAGGSTITITSFDVTLIVGVLDDLDFDFVDARPFLINGITGLSYADDPSAWNITDWNGSDAVTLQLGSTVIPEPGTAALGMITLGLLAARRRR